MTGIRSGMRSQRRNLGPHTVSHPILSRVGEGRSDYEIAESWRVVAHETDAAVPVFCYPNGTLSDFSSPEKAVCRGRDDRSPLHDRGFLESSASGVAVPDRFALARLQTTHDLPRTFACARIYGEASKRESVGTATPEAETPENLDRGEGCGHPGPRHTRLFARGEIRQCGRSDNRRPEPPRPFRADPPAQDSAISYRIDLPRPCLESGWLTRMWTKGTPLRAHART